MFDDWLARMLLQTGHTERSLAVALGISQQAVSRWRTGRARPSGVRLEGLARELGVAIEEIPTRTLDSGGIPTRSPDTAIEALGVQVGELRERLAQVEALLGPGPATPDEAG